MPETVVSDSMPWSSKSVAPWDDEPYNEAGSAAYWLQLVRADPMLSTAVVVVRVWLGGSIMLALAPQPVTVIGKLGTLPFVGALLEEPELSMPFSLESHSASQRSMRFRAAQSNRTLDYYELLKNGFVFSGLAEVALVVEGMDFSLRHVLMRGRAGARSVSSMTPFEFEVEDLRVFSNEIVPAVTVTTDRWPTAPEAARGQRIPVIVNGARNSGCIPVRMSLSDGAPVEVLYAVCNYMEALTVTTVRVNGVAVSEVSSGQYSPWKQEVKQDIFGNRIIGIDFSTSDGPWQGSEEVTVDVQVADLRNQLSLVGVVRTLFERQTRMGSRGLNTPSFATADAAAVTPRPWVVANESGSGSVTIFDLVESGVLEQFPMGFLLFEGLGLGMTVVDRRSGPSGNRAVKTLTVPSPTSESLYNGLLASMSPPVLERMGTYEEQCDLFTEYEIRWGMAISGEQTWTGVLRADPGTSAACRVALDLMHGIVNAHPVIDAPFCATEADAAAVLAWLIAHRSVPSYKVTLRCAPSALLLLKRGETVRYSDSYDMFPSAFGATATVLDITWSLKDCQVVLQVWHPYWANRI